MSLIFKILKKSVNTTKPVLKTLALCILVPVSFFLKYLDTFCAAFMYLGISPFLSPSPVNSHSLYLCIFLCSTCLPLSLSALTLILRTTTETPTGKSRHYIFVKVVIILSFQSEISFSNFVFSFAKVNWWIFLTDKFDKNLEAKTMKTGLQQVSLANIRLPCERPINLYKSFNSVCLKSLVAKGGGGGK